MVMSQARLIGLNTISIGHQLTESWDFNQIIKEFSGAKKQGRFRSSKENIFKYSIVRSTSIAINIILLLNVLIKI